MNEKINPWLIIIILFFLLAGIIIFGIYNYIGTNRRNQEAIRRAEQINRYNIAILEGKERTIEELTRYRESERNRLDREREINRREKEIEEREEQYNSRERERINDSREIYSSLGEREGDVEGVIETFKETIRRGEKIIEEIMAGNN